MSAKPKLSLQAVFGVMFFVLGYILFLTALHIVTIETVGNVSSVMSTIFIVFLNVFYAILIFGGVFVIWYVLSLLVWTIKTPEWKKRELQ